MLERFLDPRIDLHPDNLTSAQMGDAFEELIRKFEDLNRRPVSTSPARCDPPDGGAVSSRTRVRQGSSDRRIYDPTVGTGGTLSVADEFLRDGNYGVQLVTSGHD